MPTEDTQTRKKLARMQIYSNKRLLSYNDAEFKITQRLPDSLNTLNISLLQIDNVSLSSINIP